MPEQKIPELFYGKILMIKAKKIIWTEMVQKN